VKYAETFVDEKLENFLLGHKEKEYILVVNFKRYYHDTIFVPNVSTRYMEKVIASEISKQSPFAEFSFIYSLLEEKTINNKIMRKVHVFAVDMEELLGHTSRFSSCGKTVRVIYPDVYAAKSLLGKGASALGLFNRTHEQKMFFVKDGEVLFIREVESDGRDLLESLARNIHLSISYCEQTLRINPERLFLIGGSSSLPGMETLALPTASVIKPAGLDVSEEVFQKFALPLSALYGDKAIDISPRYSRNIYMAGKAQSYGAAVFGAISIIGLIYLVFTIQGALASSERLAIQKNRLAHMTGIQNTYMKTLELYSRYRPFVERKNEKAFSSLFVNLSAMDMPGVMIERLSAVQGEGGLIVEVKGLVDAQSLRETQERYDGLIKFIKGPGAMSVEESKLIFMDGSFTVRARTDEATLH